jgi:hypothetical protein
MKIRIVLVSLVMVLPFLFGANYGYAIDFRGAYSGQVVSAQSGKSWPATLKILSYDSKSGRVEGELNWTNLGSVHKIVGQLSDSRFTFRETEYIKQGGAHLNCEYNATVNNGIISGNWKDADLDNGTFQLTMLNNLAEGAVSNDDISKSIYSGQVISAQSGKSWPAILTIRSYDSKSGRVEGELNWTNLGSVHKIVGQLSDSRFAFKETEFIRQGGAHLNCEYNATIKNGIISGNWKDADLDNGTFQLKIELR